ncbi:MAG: nuclear transport factor 2 family protein [Gammaproteobacteria bacterium]
MPRITGTFEDREQIRELYARYAIYVDNSRFDEWVNCFTADGTFESPVMGKFTGHEELRRFTRQYHESWAGGGVRHMMVNVSFDIDGDTATGTCNLIYFKVHDGKSEFLLTGSYHDTLRKVGGEWRYTHRRVSLDK